MTRLLVAVRNPHLSLAAEPRDVGRGHVLDHVEIAREHAGDRRHRW